MSVVPAFAFVLFLLALGRALAWRRLVPDSAPDALNTVVLYVCLPASILLNAPQLAFDSGVLAIAAVPWALLLASVVVLVPLSRRIALPRSDRAVVLLAVPLGNTSFLGYALVPLLAGADALRYAVVYDQFGSFLILSTYGLAVIAAHASTQRPGAAAIVRRILRFPPFLALLFALTLMPAAPPPALASMLQQLAGALLPLAALALGMQLKLALPREQRRALAIGLVGKLLVLPLLALGLCAWLPLDPTMRAAVVLESAMPPMITAAALAAMAGLSPALAGALVGYGTLLSLMTLPAWRWVLGANG
jgi:predicted permease